MPILSHMWSWMGTAPELRRLAGKSSGLPPSLALPHAPARSPQQRTSQSVSEPIVQPASPWMSAPRSDPAPGADGLVRRAENGIAPAVRQRGNDGAGPLGQLAEVQGRRCSYAGCREGRTLTWRGRRRVCFEDRVACRGLCLEGLVRAAIAREGTEAPGAAVMSHRHRLPLGLILLSQGWITHPQLQRALEAQRAKGRGRIGEWLVQECGLEAERVTRGLSLQWGCPVLGTEGYSPQAMALVLPRALLRDYAVLPLRVAGSQILYRDQLDASAAFVVERMSGLRIVSGLVPEAEFQAARQRLLECTFPATYHRAVPDGDALAAEIAAVLEQRQAIASRLVRLHQHYWLRLWPTPRAGRRAGGVPAQAEEVIDLLFTLGAAA